MQRVLSGRCALITLLRSLAMIVACAALAACGQKGPLTLPKSIASQPSAASAPAR